MFVKIQIVVAKFASLFWRAISDDAYASIMQLIEGELDVVQSTYREEETSTHDIEYGILDARLHFYSVLMIKLSPESPSQQLTCKKALAAALRLIQIASWQQAATSDGGSANEESLPWRRSLPKNHYRGLVFAIMLLLKFFYLNGAAPKPERDAAAAHIKLAQNVFTICSFEEEDEYARVAKVVEALARLGKDTLEPKLRLKHLVGKSAFLDSLSTAEEIRDRPIALDQDRSLEVPSTIPTGTAHSGWNQGQSPGVGGEQTDSMLDFLLNFYDGPFTDLSMVDCDPFASNCE